MGHRQQHLTRGVRRRGRPCNRVAGLLGLLLSIRPVGALAGGFWPAVGEPAPAAGAAVQGEVAATGELLLGVVPHFRAGSRDRAQVGVRAAGWFGPNVHVGLAWPWVLDFPAEGGPISGPGDVRLDTAVCAWRTAALSAGVGWQVKLPNAANEGELGTDETDVDFGAWGQWRAGGWTVLGAVGLAVLGNPLRFAEQDDVPHAALEGGWSGGAWRLHGFATLEVQTTRNPWRGEAGVRARYGGAAFAEVQAGAGLVPASPDFFVGVSAGWAGALSTAGRGE